jgi:hypothetical protein
MALRKELVSVAVFTLLQEVLGLVGYKQLWDADRLVLLAVNRTRTLLLTGYLSYTMAVFDVGNR